MASMLAGLVTPILKGLLVNLLTEAFLKDFTIHILEKAVKQTDNDLDDKIVGDVKKAWGVKE